MWRRRIFGFGFDGNDIWRHLFQGNYGKERKIARASRVGRRAFVLTVLLCFQGCAHTNRRAVVQKNNVLANLTEECKNIRQHVEVEHKCVGKLVKVATEAKDYGSQQIACHCLKKAYPSNASANVSDEEIIETANRCIEIQNCENVSFENVKSLLGKIDNFIDNLMIDNAESKVFRTFFRYAVYLFIGFGLFRMFLFRR